VGINTRKSIVILTGVAGLSNVTTVEAVLVVNPSNEVRVAGSVHAAARHGVLEVIQILEGLDGLPDDAVLDVVRSRKTVKERGLHFFAFAVNNKVAAALVQGGGGLGDVGIVFPVGTGDKETDRDGFARGLVRFAGLDVAKRNGIRRDGFATSADLLLLKRAEDVDQ
jgi:hypothetical protein